MTKVKTAIKPLEDRALLRRSEPEEKVKGGIILPDSAKKKPETAVVVAIGPGKRDKEGKLLPMPIKVGDTVLIDKYSGQEISLDDEEMVIVRASDIIAIVE
ncbi:MAG: co-chaperone GroES [Parachlamydiales bacterium]